MALEGTIKTPMGAVQKKTALYVGGGVVILGGIVWYRHKQTAAATTTSSATTGDVDPATGYVYGTPEDAAALLAQSQYVNPTDLQGVSGGGGSASIPVSNVGFASNGEWVQAVVTYMVGNSLVSDATTLSSALGKYITGAPTTDTDRSLIQQAIAVEGFPPVAGSNGYPPSINTAAVVTGPAGTTPGTVSGLHASSVSANQIVLAWNGATGARGYDITWTDAQGHVGNATSLFPGYTMIRLPKSERYMIKVRAKHDVAPIGSSTDGPWTTAIQVTTHAK